MSVAKEIKKSNSANRAFGRDIRGKHLMSVQFRFRMSAKEMIVKSHFVLRSQSVQTRRRTKFFKQKRW